MSSMMINAYAYQSGARVIPMRAQANIPATFPMAIHHAMFSATPHHDAIFDFIQANGGDLRAYADENLSIGLPLEIVSIDLPGKKLMGFIRASSAIASGSDFWLVVSGAGGALTQPVVTDALGRNSVWADYNLVHHGSAPEIDVSGTNANATLTGGAALTTGLLNDWPAYGYGPSFGAANTDKIVWTTPNWYAAQAAETLVFYREDDAGFGRLIQWAGQDSEWNEQGGENYRWRRKGSSSKQGVQSSDDPLVQDGYTGFSMLWPTIGTAPTIRIDGGAPTGSPTITAGGGTLQAPPGDLIIMSNGGTGVFAGKFVENRYRDDNVPDTAWFDLEWDCFNNPSNVLLAQAAKEKPTYNVTPLKMLKAVPAGFPLPLHDDMFGAAGHGDAIFSKIMGNGEDLRAFTDQALQNEIPLEILTITPGSNLLKGFVRVPSALAINDKIYLRTTVGGGETAYAATDTNGRNNVWQDYEIVLHGSAPTIDVTGNNSNGTLNGGDTSPASGLLNNWNAVGLGANAGAASTDRLDFADITDVDVSTLSIICYKEATEGDTTGRVVQFYNSNTRFAKAATDEINVRSYGATTNKEITSTGGEFSSDAWHQIMHVDPGIGNTSTVYVDGSALSSPTNNNGSGAYTASSGADSWVGNGEASNVPGDIVFAELRYRPDNTPTSSWASLEWDGFNNPGSIAEAEGLVSV